MKIERIQSGAFAEAKLADGSIAIFDAETKTVYSLNATAGAAWEACQHPATIRDVIQFMGRSLGQEVSKELALDALDHLQKQRLLKTSLPSRATRRSVVRSAARLAPVVLVLTAAEQRAFAQDAFSGATTTTAAPTSTTSTTSTTPTPTSTKPTTTTAPTSTTSTTTTTTTPAPTSTTSTTTTTTTPAPTSTTSTTTTTTTPAPTSTTSTTTTTTTTTSTTTTTTTPPPTTTPGGGGGGGCNISPGKLKPGAVIC
ncbi:MAG: PqqD family protein [Acidobacteriaceae bacterium]|nr:PqqD family protein [Acidobacteriaceae bacterium]